MAEPARGRRVTSAILFLATLGTTWLAGYTTHPEADPVRAGFAYMLAVMAILVSHEAGHFLLARRNRVRASLPYFVPVPFGPVGTFGAVILMKGRIRSRDALVEVAAAGPLAGVAVTLPVLLVGLALSPVKPLEPPAVLEGQSLLYMLLKHIAVGPIPEGYDVHLHPVAWAGWIGLFLTALNLFPVGQLDGGHVLYALLGERHRRISRIALFATWTLGLLVVAHGGWVAWSRGLGGELFWMSVASRGTWIFWAFLLTLAFGRGRRQTHPPTDDDRLSPVHRAVAVACLILFAAVFTPVPLQILI